METRHVSKDLWTGCLHPTTKNTTLSSRDLPGAGLGRLSLEFDAHLISRLRRVKRDPDRTAAVLRQRRTFRVEANNRVRDVSRLQVLKTKTVSFLEGLAKKLLLEVYRALCVRSHVVTTWSLSGHTWCLDVVLDPQVDSIWSKQLDKVPKLARLCGSSLDSYPVVQGKTNCHMNYANQCGIW